MNDVSKAAIASAQNHTDMFSQGDLLFWRCEYAQAKQYFETILNQSSATPVELARCYHSLGATNAKLKNYAEALKNHEKELETLLKLETSDKIVTDTAKCYMSIGKIHCLTLNNAEAINWYKQALDLRTIITLDFDLISNIYKDLANLYTRTHDFEQAMSYFTKALDIDREQLRENHPKFGQTYANMGAMYYQQHDYKKALEYFLKANDIWQKSLASTHAYCESMGKTIRQVERKLSEISAPQYKNKLKAIHIQLVSLQTSMEPGWSLKHYDPDELNPWELIVEGPAGTPYENGRFQVTVRFPFEYPFKAPEISFITKILHPNIHPNGYICLEVLIRDTWSPTRSIRFLLKSIQKLLANPNFDDFIYPEAAFLFKDDRDKFQQKAIEWTKTFATPDVPTTSSQSSSTLENAEINVKRTEQSQLSAEGSSIWLWKFISPEKVHWLWFWNIEILILDHAYLNKQKSVELDSCIVNFDEGCRVNKEDGTKTEVIRVTDPQYNAKIREKWNAKHQLAEHVTFYNDTSSDRTPILDKCLSLDVNISAVANGIRNEGRLIGKPIEANYIAEELERAAQDDRSFVGLQCIHQYTRSSFLYISLNEFLCNNDLSKLDNLGPYLKLLFLHFKEYSLTADALTVYRGTNLSSTELQAYRQAIGPNTYRWFGFISTSRSRKVAEFYDANTLMIIQLKKQYPNDGRAVDIRVLSQFPEEEEVLLRAGVQFCVKKFELDEQKEKHIIHIEAYV
ncbi:unnamed protein product [Adineta ricciae]|uniref:UBC core domain-containing protein n=1 Tax=Adineta ricciae TaxID=249248 RepID=A0A814TX30_ADIRI|nr:unnamed protein product [Adineta ricciae]CAF1423956.1 unnamed protein product [Adineta ricciae]